MSKPNQYALFIIISCWLCGACHHLDMIKKKMVGDTTVETVKDTPAPLPPHKSSDSLDAGKPFRIKAQFVSFVLGDAAHFTFKEASGRQLDFGDCDDTLYHFGIMLPDNKATAENQGWASNKKLEGKWFDLGYVYRKQAQYIDGPIGMVPVIIAVKPLP